MARSDIFRKIVRFLTIFGGVIGFLYVFLKVYNIDDVDQWIQVLGFPSVIFINCGFLIAGFTTITALKPDNPIPWHWITLAILATLTMIFINIFPAFLIYGAAIIELTKEL